jgi:hypothetical protein
MRLKRPAAPAPWCPAPRPRGVVANKGKIRRRHVGNGRRPWVRAASRREQLQPALSDRLAEELASNLPSHDLCQQRRDRVSEHALGVAAAAVELRRAKVPTV